MKTISLLHPIEVEGREPITSIILRRPRLKDVEAMNKAMLADGVSIIGSAAASDNAAGMMIGGIALIASMNNLDLDVIREMDLEDFTALQEDLASFFPQVRSGTAGG